MSVDFWFPTVILNDTIDNQEEINGVLLTRIEEIQKEVPSGGRTWLAAPYNTCGTFDISKDPAFSTIIDEVTNKVHTLAKSLGIDTNRNKFECREGWLNIYNQNQFQEYHYHAGFRFSAVYYVQVPPNSSGIVFESPVGPDMMPMPTMLHSVVTDKTARYEVTAGQVIAFRSYLKHCVPAHMGDGERISLAFNYDLK